MAQPWIDTLTSASDKTGWFELYKSQAPVAVRVTVSGTSTTVLEVSEDLDGAADSKTATTEDTFTSTRSYLFEPGFARLFRFRTTAYTSGTVTVQVGIGINWTDELPIVIGPQGSTGGGGSVFT